MSFTITSTSNRRYTHKTSSVLLTPSKKKEFADENSATANSQQHSMKDIWSWTLTADSVTSCSVRDALEMKKNIEEGYDFFWLGRVPCRTVKVVGIVIGLLVLEKRVVYSIDDGTSVIDCTHQQSTLSGSNSSPKKQSQASKVQKPAPVPTSLQPPELPRPVAFVGQFVCVTGKLQPKHEARHIVVSSIERCDPNAELHHCQEVRRLHQTSYSQSTPFIIPSKMTQPAPLEYPTPSTATATPSSVFSSPAKSEVSYTSCQPSPQKCPRRLRHPSKLHSRELTDNTFRIYLKHYMDNAPDTSELNEEESGYDTDAIISSSLAQVPSTLTKKSRYDIDHTPRATQKVCTDQTPQPQIKPLYFGPSGPGKVSKQKQCDSFNPRGFTLSYLRRVPELREMARRVVLSEAKKRLREERKKTKESGISHTRSQKRSSSSVVMDRDKLALKMKRLFMWAVVQLLKDGCIILWDGARRSIPDDETPNLSDLWKSNTSGSSTMLTDSSMFNSLSGTMQAEDEFVDDGDLSDPQPSEEVYLPLKPTVLAEQVEKIIGRLCARQQEIHTRKHGPRKPTPVEAEAGCTKQQILASLRRDDRWRYVGEWNIDDALDYLNKEGRAWCIGQGRWELTL